MINAKIQEVIQFFGTQDVLAKALGVKQPAVSGWLNGLYGIGESNALKIEKLTGGKFKAVDLCPRLAEIDQIKTPSDN